MWEEEGFKSVIRRKENLKDDSPEGPLGLSSAGLSPTLSAPRIDCTRITRQNSRSTSGPVPRRAASLRRFFSAPFPFRRFQAHVAVCQSGHARWSRLPSPRLCPWLEDLVLVRVPRGVSGEGENVDRDV
ncbi:hypothetical protein BaRGS_00038160 [Batillaria attramentaria]|uniref:Uncharacterized protein n=1 Tax=Batillaria attramentaria TaxID=370345 RepID=A0ABD0J811_9CAEN